MTHFSDGQLQAYLDDELKPNEGREIEQHLRSCPGCVSALDQLDRAGRITTSALAALDTIPEEATLWDGLNERTGTIQLQAERRRRHRTRRRRLWAASLLLAISAGALGAAFPASPLRAWMMDAWERVVRIFEGSAGEPTPPPTLDTEPGPAASPDAPLSGERGSEAAPPSPEEAGLYADASLGPVEIELRELSPGAVVEVVFVDGSLTGVFATVEARFRSGPGRLEATIPSGGARVEVPRLTGQVLLLADGDLLLQKDGDSLIVQGAVRERDQNRIVFAIPGG